ncbi:MAG: hypothetical protein D5R98_09850 [Desulfonatronovibrio sp. MSAO_Bac4]|nr:MAG: hypothetical protein D5R98_09850 [Desulfonatronovibrio sp. MSAO_Bac4]
MLEKTSNSIKRLSPSQRIVAGRVVAKQAAESLMIIHGNGIRDLERSVIISAYPVHAGIGFKLATDKMPLYDLTIHNLGNGVRVESATLTEVVGVVLADESPG